VSAKLFEWRILKIFVICAIPCFIALLSIFGPFLTDTVYLYSGAAVHVQAGGLAGFPTIDPNAGFTSFALGARAALDLLSGHLPLWNHYEGLGTPLLGEMQSAALFPPTLLLAFPHGQALEQAFLQLVAGAGSFLFFRTFGLGSRAALCGSLLFEINGVFAWLRNAIYNPVAFLPWLFFAVEGMHATARAERPLRRRLPLICVGAVMAALAVYAGLPEEVYLCSLLLMGWVAVRMVELSVQQALIFVGDLLLTGLIALALSAPLLVAFVDFLGEAALRGHSGNGFYGAWLNCGAIIQYMMPYIFGPIFASTNQTIRDIWGSTGGYIGFAPIVVALAALFSPGRRGVKIFLVGWVVVALGVTHGLPGIYQAFMTLPLVKVTASYRYLNASWIFCVIFLCALFIDRAPALPQPMSRWILIGAVACGLLSIVVAAVGAWPLVLESWRESYSFIVGALLSVAVLSFCIVGAACLGRTGSTATVVSGILLAEAMAWFLLPYFSYPREANIDNDAISFLRANIGYQRILNTAGDGLAPNYGSYYGIPQLNYNDLPAPKATAKYIKATLDPYADKNIFIPDWPVQNADRAAIFQERLSRYAQAGVKYVLVGADFAFTPAFAVLPAGKYAYPLVAGARVKISAQAATTEPLSVTAVSLLVGTYNNTSTGHLKVTLCAYATCAEGLSDVESAEDNKPLRIALSQPIRMEVGTKYTIIIEKLDGNKDVALWMFPLTSTNNGIEIIGNPTTPRDKYLPDVRFLSGTEENLVYRGRSMGIYELPNTRDYFSGPSCTFVPLSHDRINASCIRSSKLIRLELFMQGWSATVNGQPAPVGISDGVFQTIDLPAGDVRVRFTYEPPGFKLALVAAATSLLFVCAVLISVIRGVLASRSGSVSWLHRMNGKSLRKSHQTLRAP
jgi:hypothetical protein